MNNADLHKLFLKYQDADAAFRKLYFSQQQLDIARGYAPHNIAGASIKDSNIALAALEMKNHLIAVNDAMGRVNQAVREYSLAIMPSLDFMEKDSTDIKDV